MSENEPPRRSRRAPKRDANASLPIVPILIGVVVLGFVIGAGASLVSHGGGSAPDRPVAIASGSAPTASPFDAVTPAPTEPPTPDPTDAPTDAATDRPSAPATIAPTPVRTPKVVARERVAPVARSTAAPAATSVGPSVAPATPVASDVRASATPSTPPAATAAPTAAATAEPTTAPVAAGAAPTPSGDAFSRLAGNVVREYLNAVAHDDEASAYAALGANPGDKGASLSEATVVDSRSKVARVDAHPVANGDALVNVVVTTPSGPYYGTYTVHRTETGAAVITAHELTKP